MLPDSSAWSLLSVRRALEFRRYGGFRCETGEGQYQERKRDEAGKHPERERRKLLQARNQVGVIHVKGRPQNDVRSNHADDMDTDPLFAQHAQPGFLAKASCPIASECSAIPTRCQNDEVRISW